LLCKLDRITLPRVDATLPCCALRRSAPCQIPPCPPQLQRRRISPFFTASLRSLSNPSLSSGLSHHGTSSAAAGASAKEESPFPLQLFQSGPWRENILTSLDLFCRNDRYGLEMCFPQDPRCVFRKTEPRSRCASQTDFRGSRRKVARFVRTGNK